MHCGVKRKLDCLSDDEKPKIERDYYHQQALLNISVHKLQEEQVKHGIESRLLRFVLINNAIKVLQAHIISAEDNSDDSFTLFRSLSSSDVFLSNTRSHGVLSFPPPSPSPPTPNPAKITKFEIDHTSSDSPLANSCSFPNLGCSEAEDNVAGACTPDEVRLKGAASSPGSCCNGSISSLGPLSNEMDDIANECKKKRPRTLTITIDDQLPSLQPSPFDDCDHFLSPSPPGPSSSPTTPTSSEHSSSLSPIDFAKVDVSLYDFDAHTNLVFPPVTPDTIPPHPHTTAPSRLSCSLQAQSFTQKLEHLYDIQQHTDEEDDIEEEEEEENEISESEDMTLQEDEESGGCQIPDEVDPNDSGEGIVSSREGEPGPSLSSNTSITASSSSSSPVESLSPDGFDNFDDPHEIDRIVSLLMA